MAGNNSMVELFLCTGHRPWERDHYLFILADGYTISHGRCPRVCTYEVSNKGPKVGVWGRELRPQCLVFSGHWPSERGLLGTSVLSSL